MEELAGARLKMLFRAEVVEFKSGEDEPFISGAGDWLIEGYGDFEGQLLRAITEYYWANKNYYFILP